MPTYDYVCDACGKEFEIFHSIKDDPKTDCPECGAAQLRRRIGAGGGLIFKGSGFYITDYRSDSYQQQAKADTGTSSSQESKSSEAKSSEPKTTESSSKTETTTSSSES